MDEITPTVLLKAWFLQFFSQVNCSLCFIRINCKHNHSYNFAGLSIWPFLFRTTSLNLVSDLLGIYPRALWSQRLLKEHVALDRSGWSLKTVCFKMHMGRKMLNNNIQWLERCFKSTCRIH